MIRADELTKAYGEARAIDGVSFEVEAGQVVGLLGPNGAGKSTTMRIMTGFLYPDAGSVHVDGVEVHPEDPATKLAVGYLPESTPLYARMRVGDYLDFIGRMRGLSAAARRDALERVTDACGLAGWSRHRIAHLSKGYRQRVGLAQALFGDPKVLVLDEPTSGLDPGEITRIRALIKRLGETKTVVFSTHVLAEVQETCSRVIILAGGRVVADGSPLDLAEEEAAELHVTFLRGAGDAGDPREVLAGLPGVHGARPLGTDSSGRTAVALAVADRWSVAERVVAELAARDWRLIELRHDLPSLERVFLSRTSHAATTTSSNAQREAGS